MIISYCTSYVVYINNFFLPISIQFFFFFFLPSKKFFLFLRNKKRLIY